MDILRAAFQEALQDTIFVSSRLCENDEQTWKTSSTSLPGPTAWSGISGVIERLGLGITDSLSCGAGAPGHGSAIAGNGAGCGDGGASTQEKAANRPPWKGQHQPRRGAGQKHRKNHDAQIVEPQVLRKPHVAVVDGVNGGADARSSARWRGAAFYR